MQTKLTILLIALLGRGSATAARAAEASYTILPVSEGPSLMKQCSRPAPTDVTGFWQPSQAQVQSIEKRLPAFLAKGGYNIKLSESRRQYIGIISRGKKLIYLNAFPAAIGAEMDPGTNWKRDAVIICDGGDSIWGVEFDPADNSFHDLEFNGFA